jgi:hypothetical protein
MSMYALVVVSSDTKELHIRARRDGYSTGWPRGMVSGSCLGCQQHVAAPCSLKRAPAQKTKSAIVPHLTPLLHTGSGQLAGPQLCQYGNHYLIGTSSCTGAVISNCAQVNEAFSKRLNRCW